MAVEDRRFYQRDLVIDVRSMARALFEDVKASVRAKKIKIVEGGSTIPQQLVKQLLPAEERQKRHLTRKFKELVLASRLVQTFTKDEILTFYLNEVYLGHNRFGVEAASQFYFDKKVDMLRRGLSKIHKRRNCYKRCVCKILRQGTACGVGGAKNYAERLRAFFC